MVVTSAGEQRADVLVGDRKIVGVVPATDSARNGEEFVDATGLLIFPGVVDPHTHLFLDTGTDKTVDDFASGSASAAAGGVTTYIDFATQQPGQNFQQSLDGRLAQINGRSYVDHS